MYSIMLTDFSLNNLYIVSELVEPGRPPPTVETHENMSAIGDAVETGTSAGMKMRFQSAWRMSSPSQYRSCQLE